MSKSRKALEKGMELVFDSRRYQILETMSENGGSCLVYKAERLPTEHHPHGLPLVRYVIKEFYPKSLVQHISRGSNGELLVARSGLERFIKAKRRFVDGVARQTAFYDEASNYAIMGYPEIYEYVNGTVYSALSIANGTTLNNVKYSTLSVYEIAQIMTSLCNAVDKLHAKGQLYLDIKPENIFLFDREVCESRRIALFDFDTVVEKDNLPTVGFYSRGWSPYEQELWQSDEITEATDNYSIGALLYWLLFGQKVPDGLPTRILRGDFSFLNGCLLLHNMKSAKTAVQNLLKATLNNDHKERMQRAGDLIKNYTSFTDLAGKSVTVKEPTMEPIVEYIYKGFTDIENKLSGLKEVTEKNIVSDPKNIVYDLAQAEDFAAFGEKYKASEHFAIAVMLSVFEYVELNDLNS